MGIASDGGRESEPFAGFRQEMVQARVGAKLNGSSKM